MNLAAGSVFNLCHEPLKVSRPLAAEPQLGMSRISENAMPTDCTQSGSAVYIKWCEPAHMYTEISAQKLTIEKR